MQRDFEEEAFDLLYAETDASGAEPSKPITAQNGGGPLVVGAPCKTSAELEKIAKHMAAHPVEVIFEERDDDEK